MVDIKNKNCEDYCEELEEKYKNIIFSSPTGMHFYKLDENDDLIFIAANPSAEMALNIEHNELSGLKIKEAFPGLKDYIVDLYKKVAKGEILNKSFETYYNDEKIDGYYKVDVFSHEKGQVCATFMDITNLKKLQIELIKSKEKAEESDRLKTSFLASMSHEIRTPMNGIIGFAELLKEPNISDKDKEDFVKIIEKSGKRMLNILNNIISISKIDAGIEEVNLVNTNINSQLEYVHDFFKIEVDKKEIKLSLKDKLPNKYTFVKTDSEKINSILINLVKNSIKYSDASEIIFGCKKQKNVLMFYVEDDGIGISKDEQKNIFSIFTQLKNSNGKSEGGMGLGLAISKNYIEMLGGNIWLESEIGKGSKFYFEIPYIKGRDEEHEKEISTTTTTDYQNLGKNYNFLIIEDDKSYVTLLTALIKRLGGNVFEALDYESAIKICKNNNIDLIFVDIHIPKIDGFEMAKEIKKINKKITIIAQTECILDGEKELTFSVGFDEYLIKPLKMEELKNLIKKHIIKSE